MSKSIFLLIILGLIVPYFHTKIVTFNDILSKKNINTGISKRNGDDGNAEEVIDFWDFDPHANTKSAKITPKKAAIDNKVSTQTLKTPRGATYAERKQLKEIDKILKEMDRLLEKSQQVSHHSGRVLLEGNDEIASDIQDNNQNGVIPSEEEDIDNGEEGNIPEDGEEGPIPETPEDEEEETNNGGGDNENNENNEQPPGNGEQPEQPEEGNNNGEENVNLGEIPDEGMATISLTTLFRYDTTMGEFYNQGGQAKFVKAVADVLDVDEGQVRVLSIREGSVIIESEITKTAGDEMTKEEAVELMKTWTAKLQAAIKDGRMNIYDNADILDFSSQILVFTPNTDKNDPAGEGYIIALAVVLSLVIIALVAWFTCKYRKGVDEPHLIGRQAKYRPSATPGSQGEMLDLESKIEHQNHDDNSIHLDANSPDSGRQENDEHIYDRAHRNNSNSKKKTEVSRNRGLELPKTKIN